MGASVSVFWPGITETQRESQPGFFNDCKAWGNWMAERESHDDVLQAVRDLGVGALLTFKTDGVEDSDVDWVTPAALEEAACRLRDLVLAEDPRAGSIIATYSASANGVEPVRVELAKDLEDIAAIARFARAEGASRLTLEVNW